MSKFFRPATGVSMIPVRTWGPEIATGRYNGIWILVQNYNLLYKTRKRTFVQTSNSYVNDSNLLEPINTVVLRIQT